MPKGTATHPAGSAIVAATAIASSAETVRNDQNELTVQKVPPPVLKVELAKLVPLNPVLIVDLVPTALNAETAQIAGPVRNGLKAKPALTVLIGDLVRIALSAANDHLVEIDQNAQNAIVTVADRVAKVDRVASSRALAKLKVTALDSAKAEDETSVVVAKIVIDWLPLSVTGLLTVSARTTRAN